MVVKYNSVFQLFVEMNSLYFACCFFKIYDWLKNCAKTNCDLLAFSRVPHLSHILVWKSNLFICLLASALINIGFGFRYLTQFETALIYSQLFYLPSS